ncbi:MAG: hypothetical protein FWF59_15625 [Turicibacter sp.]|nr:hypothetical protein [Turicibacter sp.]
MLGRQNKLNKQDYYGIGILGAIMAISLVALVARKRHHPKFKDIGVKNGESEGLEAWLGFAKKQGLNPKKWKRCGRSNYLVGRHYQELKSYQKQYFHPEATALEVDTLKRMAQAKDLKFIDDMGFNREERRVWLEFSKVFFD